MSLPPIGSFLSFAGSTSPTSVNPSKKCIGQLEEIKKKGKIILPGIKTPLKKRITETESLAKNQHTLKLNNDHLILRSIIAVEKEEASLQDESSFNRSFKRISAAIKLVGKGHENRSLELRRFSNNLVPIQNKKLAGRYKSIDIAQGKWWIGETAMWLNKKGRHLSLHLSKNFLKFLRELFEALDEDKNGILTADEFIIPLLSYGITTEPLYIERALLLLMHCKSLETIKIEKERFLQLFQEDCKTDVILKALQFHTASLLKEEEEVKLARKKTIAGVIRTETKIEDVVPRVYCTVEEMVKTMRIWWRGLLGSNERALKYPADCIHTSTLTEFLVSKRLVGNNIEAMRLCNSLQKSDFVFYDHFELIFIKAILKSALMNLAVGLSSDDFSGNDSLLMKLAACQRKFMIAGLSLRNTDLSAQGKKALQAVSKYQSAHADSSRVKVMQKAHEELESGKGEVITRLKGYLYKINEHAQEFIDEKGEISTELVNPWDVRDQVNRFGKKLENSIDPDETFNQDFYTSLLSPVASKIRKFSHFPAKVKLFREAHLLENFKTMSGKNERYRNYNNQSI